MNRRDPLILVADPQVVSSGLWPDRHSVQTPLWEVAQNIRFAGGKVERRVPNILVTQYPEAPPPPPIRGIGQAQDSDGVRWLYFAAGAGIYRWYGPAPVGIIQLPNFTLNATSTQEPSFFDFTPWGDWMIINSADNGATLWKPGDYIGVLPNAPQDAVAYFKKRNQLLAVGHGPNRRLVSVSDADDITNWSFNDPTTLAVQLPLEELATPTRAACHFGPSIAVFGENQMFEVKWVGSPFYYGQNKLLDGIGAVGKMAVCGDGPLVYGCSRNGCWKTDGVQYSYIDEVVLRDYLQSNINWTQGAKIVVRKNDLSGCIEFSFPMRGSLFNNEAWAYDPRYGGWSQVPSFEVMDNRILFDKPLQGDNAGRVFLIEDNPALASPLLLETKAMLMQRDNQALHLGALIDEVELFIHSVSNVEFQYGVSELPDGPWSWSDPNEVVIDQITYKLDSRLSGTYHKLRFKSFNDNWSLDLQGFALFGVADGQKRDKS